MGRFDMKMQIASFCHDKGQDLGNSASAFCEATGGSGRGTLAKESRSPSCRRGPAEGRRLSARQRWRKRKELQLYPGSPTQLPPFERSKAQGVGKAPFLLSPWGTVPSSLPQSPPILTASHQLVSPHLHLLPGPRMGLRPVFYNSVWGSGVASDAEPPILCLERL